MARFDPNHPVDPALLMKLEADLSLVRTEPLHGYSAERVLARLNQAALEASPAELARARRPARAPRLWLFAASLAVLAAAAGLLGRRPPAALPVTPAPSVSGAFVPLPDSAQPLPLVPSAQGVTPSPVQGVEANSPRPRTPHLASSAAPLGRDKELLERELTQLGQIRQALVKSPGTALALADAGHREFKAGVMHEEREALAVIALASRGSRAAFEARAGRFLKAYPNSGFRERVTNLLEGKPPKVAP